MSQLGIRWKLDGVPAAFITRDPVSGRYRVTFEREEAALEQIEGIRWDAPTVERVTDAPNEPGLPEGCGFTLVELRYRRTAGIFVAEVETARQFWGDVAGCQAEIDRLTEAVRQQQTAAEEQARQLQTLETDMSAAYQEGVEAHG